MVEPIRIVNKDGIPPEEGAWADREADRREYLEQLADPTRPRPFRSFTPGQTPRELPHNIEAEAALLGALMIDNRLVGNCGPDIQADHFYEPIHGDIFEAIRSEVASGGKADPVLLRPRFANHEGMKALGGPGYLARLTGSGAALIGVRSFANQVVELAKKRHLIRILQDALDAVADGEHYVGLDTIVASIDGGLAEAIRVDESTSKTTMSVARAWDETMTRLDEVARGESDPGMKIDAQLQDWNDGLGNMRRGNMIVLAGRPGMGKTALACTVARCAALAGWGTDMYSLEEDTVELMPRFITDHCFEYGESFTLKQLTTGKINAWQRQQIDEARSHITNMPLFFHERGAMTVGQLIMDMRRRKRALAAKGRSLDVVLVDYLQLLKPDRDRGNKTQEITEMTRDLKLAAKELGVALVLLSQLSREVEKREDKRPQLSDLRDSGSIEQDADAVIFVFREEYYLEAAEPAVTAKGRETWEQQYQASRDKVELIFRKVRRNKTSTKTCRFYAEHQAVRGSKFQGNIR